LFLKKIFYDQIGCVEPYFECVNGLVTVHDFGRGELIQTGLLFATYIALVLKEKEKWKHLIWLKPI